MSLAMRHSSPILIKTFLGTAVFTYKLIVLLPLVVGFFGAKLHH
jgi:hypothetical protein